ncbi:hypothetical protein IscW_ISCW009592 [Ixodes scapularis]|uniref:Uncharacterized protein n=1 Tax=Ixodes scapularis TaxID=6945 RepID=B7PZT4_IXOSC|nr:hypothetical protein IscW_ISCW009592 [Ixodes scapularis]|eukprot:XP_002406005.1 hypothetical protein IscW_ISCW009592 [Ixodes scapularis]
MSDTKVIVLVPSSTEHQRRVILERLKRHIMYLSLVRLLFVLKPGDELPYKQYPGPEKDNVGRDTQDTRGFLLLCAGVQGSPRVNT